MIDYRINYQVSSIKIKMFVKQICIISKSGRKVRKVAKYDMFLNLKINLAFALVSLNICIFCLGIYRRPTTYTRGTTYGPAGNPRSTSGPP